MKQERSRFRRAAALLAHAVAIASLSVLAHAHGATIPYAEDFENPGAVAWQAGGAWHVTTAPETVRVIPGIRDSLVLFPDDGFWPQPPGGDGCLVSSDESTGTYVAPWDPAAQQAWNGGLSLATRSDTAESPVILAGPNRGVILRFRTWWEVESVRPDSADRLVVEYSTDSGGTYQLVDALADTTLPLGEDRLSLGSGGFDAPPLWVERSYALPSGAGGMLRFRFLFQTVDSLRNGFRGWFLDDVSVVCDSLYPPYDLAASDTACGAVALTWSDSSSANLVYYSVGRAPLDSVAIDTIALGLSATAYDDTSAEVGARYRYFVWGDSPCGASGLSEPDTGGVPAAVAAPASFDASDSLCGAVSLTWNSGGGGEEGFLLFRNDTLIGTTTGSSFDDSSASPGSMNGYAVAAYNWCDTLFAAADTGSIRAGAPDPLSVTATDSLCHEVRVSWDTTSGDFDAWAVIRDGDSLGLVARGSVPLWIDAAADSGVALTYIVYGVSACGRSPGSAHDTGLRLGRPPTPIGCFATDDRCADVMITWSPSGAPGSVERFVVYRDGDSIGVRSSAPYSIEDSLGAENTGYLYEVRAWNACAYSVASSADSGLKGAVPPTPSGVAATDSECFTVEVTWDTTEGIFLEYVVYRDGDSIGTVAADSSRLLVDATIDSMDIASYTVRTRSACGSSFDSGADTGMRTGLPPPPVDCSVTDSLCGRSTISWDAPASPGVVDRYVIYRDGDSLFMTTGPPLLKTDTSAAPNVPHLYAVRSWNGCGYSLEAPEDSGGFFSRPEPPESLTATTDRCETIHLEWGPPAGGGPVWGYEIVRSAPPGGTIILDSIVYAYDDAPGVGEVVYSVRAFNCEDSEAAVDTGRLVSAPPPAPDSCTAALSGCDSVALSWPAVEGASLGYLLFRDGTDPVDSVGPGVLASGEGGVPAGEDLVYRVFSVNRCGRSAEACSVAARIPGPIDPPPAGACSASYDSCAGIHVSWEWAPADAAWFRVRRLSDGALVDSVPAGTGTVFDGSPSPGDTVAYAVEAGNDCFVSAGACTTTGARPPLPSAPTACSASDNRCDVVRLSWTWSFDNIGQEILGFRIYRRKAQYPSAPTDTFFVSPQIGDVTWDDSDVEVGIDYFYRIAAYGRCGETSGNCQATGRSTSTPRVPALLAPDDGASDLTVPLAFDWEEASRATDYRLEIARNDSFDPPVLDTVLAPTSYTLDGADTTGVYYWRVRGRGECGPGEPSPVRTFSIGYLPGLEIVSGGDSFSFGNGADSLFLDSLFVFENEWFDTLAWSIEDTLPWVALTPAAGSLAPGERESVAVSIGAHRCGVPLAESLFVVSDPLPAGRGPLTLHLSLDPEPRPTGDVDWNCRSDVTDARRIVDALLGDFLGTAEDSAGADANGDGRINVADLVLLGSLLVGDVTPAAPVGEGNVRLFLAGEKGREVRASAPFPIRAARLFWSVEGETGARFEPIDAARAALAYDGTARRGVVFYFNTDEEGAAEAPLFRVAGGPGEGDPLLRAEAIEVAGASGEELRTAITGVVLDPGGVPAALSLSPIRPNPFNGSAVIPFALPRGGRVAVRIFSVRGALVRMLLDETRGPGPHEIVWRGDSDAGRPAASGLYFVRVESGGEAAIARLTLIR